MYINSVTRIIQHAGSDQSMFCSGRSNIIHKSQLSYILVSFFLILNSQHENSNLETSQKPTRRWRKHACNNYDMVDGILDKQSDNILATKLWTSKELYITT